MRRHLATGLALGLITALTSPVVTAQEESAFEINEYRIESWDCFACAPSPIMDSVADLQSYLADTRAVLDGNAYSDGVYTVNRERSAARRNSARRDTQVVFLDFDAGGDPTFPVCFTTGQLFGIFNDHVYTEAERDTIQARIEADYGDYNFRFTQDEPTSGEFTTILFGQNDAPADCSQGSNITLTPTGGLSILFGQAEAIDFLNQNMSDNAFADASLWEFLAQGFGAGTFEALSGLSVADFGGDLTAAVSEAVVNQSANTGAHEAGHIQGLRHQNSFGAPGDGLPSTGAISPFEFVPTFDGPSDADETVLHTMASGASVGLSLTGSTITDRFFSERSAVRLAVNEQGRTVTEDSVKRKKNRIDLKNIRTPNTIVEGQNEDARIRVDAVVLEGSIDELGEVDSYFFRARGGLFFNAEIIPILATGETFEEGILGQVSVFLQNKDGSETLVAFNAGSFESIFDREIFDAVLPENGLYRLQIAAPDEFFPVDLNGDGVLDPLPISTAGGAPELLTGNYQVLVFTCEKRLNDRKSRDFAAAE